MTARTYPFFRVIQSGTLFDLDSSKKTSQSVQFDLDPALAKGARSVPTFFLRPTFIKMYSGGDDHALCGWDSLQFKGYLNSKRVAHAMLDVPGWRAWQAVVPVDVLTVEQNTLNFERVYGYVLDQGSRVVGRRGLVRQ